MVRYPGDRFQLLATEAIEPPRDAEGKIDVERTMQVITDVVEGWVREHPEQWLWLHRRWRDDVAASAAIQPPDRIRSAQIGTRYRPVLTLVHSRFISRCVFWSCAVMT